MGPLMIVHITFRQHLKQLWDAIIKALQSITKNMLLKKY